MTLLAIGFSAGLTAVAIVWWFFISIIRADDDHMEDMKDEAWRAR